MAAYWFYKCRLIKYQKLWRFSMKLRSRFLLILIVVALQVLVVGGLTALAAPKIPVRPPNTGADATCYLWTPQETADKVADELLHYATALQTGEVTDATMGHVVALSELIQEIRNASQTCRGGAAVE